MLPFPTNLQDFVLWLGSAGAASVIVSVLLDKIPAWLNWQSPAKAWVVVAIFIALPFVSNLAQWALGAVDPALRAQVENILSLAMGGLLAWSASQLVHKVDKLVINKVDEPEVKAEG